MVNAPDCWCFKWRGITSPSRQRWRILFNITSSLLSFTKRNLKRIAGPIQLTTFEWQTLSLYLHKSWQPQVKSPQDIVLEENRFQCRSSRVFSIYLVHDKLHMFIHNMLKEDSRRAVRRSKYAWRLELLHSDISVGNFGLLFQTFRFFENFPVGRAKFVSPFTFRPKFPEFLGKW